MGASLAKASQWTAVSEVGKGKLELSPLNEKLILEIIKFVEGFSTKYMEESDHVFKDPLSWETSIHAADFGVGYTVSGLSVVSDDKDPKGSPLLEMGNGVMKVRSMRQAAAVLRSAKNKATAEARACLEANSDPAVKILGPAFATVSTEDHAIIRMVDKTKEDESGEDSVRLRLLLILQQLDMRLLTYCLSEISKHVRLTPEVANAEVELLIGFAGDETTTPLKHIGFTSSHVFSNGCRAVPWRQLHGDVCYVSVKPHDGDRFCVTASTYGWFENGGHDEDTNEVKHEKRGDVHKDLISLLRAKSARFAENIDKQSTNVRRGGDDDGTDGGSVGDAAPSDSEVDDDDDDSSEGEKESAAPSEKFGSEVVGGNYRGKIKNPRRKKLEPSLKWKAIEASQRTEKSIPKKKKKEVVRRSSPAQMRRKSSVRVKSSPTERDMSDSSDGSDDEEDVPAKGRQEGADVPPEYWQIQKLVKYLKGGNQSATLIALCSMMDFNLDQEACQFAIRDVGGLEVMINLLDTEENKCKIGALKILKEITDNVQIRMTVADLGGLQTMVEILTTRNKELKALTAETIANVARFKRARRTVRQYGGIKRLVGLLDFPENSRDAARDMEVARCGALALLSCAKSKKNKMAAKRAGIIPLLARLLKSDNVPMLVPVVGTLQECATEMSYRTAVRKEGMVPHLVRNLSSDNAELQMYCAAAIFRSAEDVETRNLVRKYNGLEPLVKLLAFVKNKELLAAATGAIWKCCRSEENVAIFQKLGAIGQLVGLLRNNPEEVLINACGALAECAKEVKNRNAIRSSGGIPLFIKLLTGTNQSLLVNCTDAVGLCAQEVEAMSIIERLDGVRLIWSLLKNPSKEVQASAAWAICPCVLNAKDSGEMVRSFVGGLELIVSMLKSDDIDVLASSCGAIANIARDEENLAVITDHGVVPMLAKLARTNEDKLRRRLADAIAQCCSWGNNRVAFGKEKAVAPLVGYLRSKDLFVHRSTARALHQLSKEPLNCIEMHEAGVVKHLLKMVGSDDVPLQESAAGCISNIRHLAIANEKHFFG